VVAVHFFVQRLSLPTFSSYDLTQFGRMLGLSIMFEHQKEVGANQK
jgi:hypothetical protein